MRGKLEQPKGLIELLSIEVERIDTEYMELWLGYEFKCPGGEYKSATPIPITTSKKMTDCFFKELIDEAERLSDMDGNEPDKIGLYISNKSESVLPVKNLCQRVVDITGIDMPLEENREYIDLCTTGIHFKEPSKSLNTRDFDERLKLFMFRARDKMTHGYYTIAADDLEKAKFLCSTSPLIYKLIGICHRELGHMDLAKEMFSTALELGDVDKDTFLYLAETSFFLNDMEYAEAVLERMILQYPGDIRSTIELANVRYQLGKKYLDIIDKAYFLDKDTTQKTILQTFVFKRAHNKPPDWISTKGAAAMLKLPVKTIRALAMRQRIPVRVDPPGADNQTLIFDEDELKAWAFVYRRYQLFEDEVDRIMSASGENSDQGRALLS